MWGGSEGWLGPAWGWNPPRFPSPCSRHPAPYSPPRLKVPWGQGPRLLGTWVSSHPGHWLLSPPLLSSLPSSSPPPCPLLCPLLPLPPPSPSPASFLSLPRSIETQLPAHSPLTDPLSPFHSPGSHIERELWGALDSYHTWGSSLSAEETLPSGRVSWHIDSARSPKLCKSLRPKL